ncbi:hypothetical protein DPMN_104694 [Dreissena polymorpha]|uniref:Uncharacterized protein n=1 Tax=Dreissena polymorpha TaxID=45954 RepID=A0A9D4K2U8_DREPO|nr:hypothetical protein DPMN_104694 [Dreissena polymorpha]
MSTRLHCPSSFSDGLDLPQACPGEQSCTESPAWRLVQTKASFRAVIDQHVLQSCPDVLVCLVLRVIVVNQSSETFMFNCLYPAFFVRMKEKDGAYEGFILKFTAVGDGSSTDGDRNVVVMDSLLHYLLKKNVEQDGGEHLALTDAI